MRIKKTPQKCHHSSTVLNQYFRMNDGFGTKALTYMEYENIKISSIVSNVKTALRGKFTALCALGEM